MVFRKKEGTMSFKILKVVPFSLLVLTLNVSIGPAAFAQVSVNVPGVSVRTDASGSTVETPGASVLARDGVRVDAGAQPGNVSRGAVRSKKNSARGASSGATVVTQGAGVSTIVTGGAEAVTNIGQQTTRVQGSGVVHVPAAATAARGNSYANSDLNGADFSGRSLAGASFVNASLVGANFAGANLSGADFSNADVSGANFAGANLRATRFSNAETEGANFEGAFR